MESLYKRDLAYIHAAAFGSLAQGAAPEIVRVLKSAPVEIRRIVDIGCGAGLLTAALAEAGFEVTGIDASAELLSIARTAVSRARFIHGSIYEAQIPDCEALVALGEPLTYHTEHAAADSLVARFFRAASEILLSGGMLIFDVIELGEPPLAGRYWNSGEDWAVLAETEEDQSARALVRNIQTFRRLGKFYRRSRETTTFGSSKRLHSSVNSTRAGFNANGTSLRRAAAWTSSTRVFLNSHAARMNRDCSINTRLGQSSLRPFIASIKFHCALRSRSRRRDSCAL